MLTILVYSLVILGIIHLIYESIILPSLRLELRYKLFALRDRLRELKIENDNQLTSKACDYIESSINVGLNILPILSYLFIAETLKKVEKYPLIEKSIDMRIEEIENCQIQELKEIQIITWKIFDKALIYNHGGLFLYIFPYILFKIAIDNIRIKIKRLSMTPKSTWIRFMEDDKQELLLAS